MYGKSECGTELGHEVGPESKKAVLRLGYLRPTQKVGFKEKPQQKKGARSMR